jgi:anti-sigma B factor antagonist
MIPGSMVAARFERRAFGEITVLYVRAKLDVTAVSDLRPDVWALAATRVRKLVVNLEGLKLIDSPGVGLLISLWKLVRESGGRVCFVGLADQPKEIFRLLRLERSLDVQATIADAVRRLNAPC